LVEDAIGLVILIIVAIVLIASAGFAVLFSFDLFSSSVSWFGQGPAIGWTLLGAMGGALFGIVQGMKARGKSDDLRRIYFAAALAGVVLLAAGVTSPAGRVLLGR
jgi:hypothetical protein